MISETNKKKCGAASFALFLTQLIATALLLIVARNYGGGGHPPGGVMLMLYTAVGICIASPIGLILGVIGAPHRSGLALVGLVGNVLLLSLVYWFVNRL